MMLSNFPIQRPLQTQNIHLHGTSRSVLGLVVRLHLTSHQELSWSVKEELLA